MVQDTIKVLIVDDHEMVRLRLSAYLETESDISVIGEAETGRLPSNSAAVPHLM